MFQKFPSDKINGTKSSRAPTHHSFTFNSQFLYELKHRFISLKLYVGFSIFDSVSFSLNFIFFNLRRPIHPHWFKNVLLELFSLQLCLFFFHKMIKFYKNICSAWINRTCAEISFTQIDVICVVKMK